jgi:hypothetical protein
MNALNLTSSELGSAEDRGSSCVETFMPSLRAFGGRKERKRRADRAPREKGLNLTVTSVMNLVIMMGGRPECSCE